MDVENVWRYLVRHRIALRDSTLGLLGLGVALYIAFAVDIFKTEGDLGLHQAEVEFDEVLLIGTVLGVVLLAYADDSF